MPMPRVLPTMTARPKPRPSTRRRPAGAAALRLEGDKDDIDRMTDVASRMARAAGLELDVAGLPSIDDGFAVRRVLDLTAGQVHDDRVGAVRVEAFPRADLHARAEHGDAVVLELRHEAHAGERRIARFRSGGRRSGRWRRWRSKLNDHDL